MRIAIIGPSALGVLLAASLARAKNEVWLLDNDAKRAKKLSAEGIKLEGLSGSYRAKVNATANAKEIEKPEAVFVCTKSYDTENALKGAKNLLDENTYVISLQDGVGNLQMINEFVNTGSTLGGVTSQGAAMIEDGHVRHTSRGDTIIGQENGKVMGAIREISSVLNKANFPTKVTKDINSVIWGKLIIDASINALSAVTRLRSGALVKNEYTREIMRRTVSEAAKVAKRKKVKLTYDDPIQKVEAVCKATADSSSSMLEDVLNRRPTEIDSTNGAIIRQAKSLNIKTPTNEMLVELVKGIESNYKGLVV